MTRQMRITIRQDGLLILRGRTSKRAWCPRCRAEGDMITVDRAVAISGTPSRESEAWLESLDLHRISANGSPLICLKSLVDCVTNKKTS